MDSVVQDTLIGRGLMIMRNKENVIKIVKLYGSSSQGHTMLQ